MDHTEAPILQALASFRAQGGLSFAPPGHKQGRGASRAALEALGADVYAADILAVGALDDRLERSRVLPRAHALMADAVHAEHTYFSTCGSSLAVKAAMLAAAGPHEQLLIGRDAHKSVAAGLILAGVSPVWVEPTWDGERHLAHPPSAAAYAEAWRAHPKARGALVTSPTPYGSAADLAAIAEVCHARGRPLIVDEAWGAHLPFHSALPAWAMDAGADVCVTSIHKAGSGLEQGSVFHLQGNLIDPAALAQRAGLLHTTSPSVLILAAIDAWRQQMVQEGGELLEHALTRATGLHREIEKIEGLHVYGHAELSGPGLAAQIDPLHTVIDVAGLGTTGYRFTDVLHDQYGIGLHLADHRRVNAELGYADDDRTTGALLEALAGTAAATDRLRPAPAVDVPTPADLQLEQVCLPRAAFFGPVEDVPVDEAAGRVAAEMLTPYPPGIPVALPGERLSEPVLRYLRTGLAAGMLLADAADPSLRTVRVVHEAEEV